MPSTYESHDRPSTDGTTKATARQPSGSGTTSGIGPPPSNGGWKNDKPRERRKPGSGPGLRGRSQRRERFYLQRWTLWRGSHGQAAWQVVSLDGRRDPRPTTEHGTGA